MLLRLLVASVALATAAALVQTWRLHEMVADHDRQRADAAELARLQMRASTTRVKEIDRASDQRLRASSAVASAARADALSLRDALAASADRASTAAGCADVTADRDRLAGLLSEAADLAAGCQEQGQRLADTVTGLQAYVGQVCEAGQGADR